MSKLNIDQQTVKELFSNKKSDFLIPDYQRPYAWGDAECETLWDDIFAFAFPDDDYSKFDSDNDEYFLGPIVTFKNENKKLEIIDGQQRLTTLMLLLRAFYSFFGAMKDSNSKKTADDIAKCIWKTDEFGTPNMDALKIDSEVSSDIDKDEFLTLLKSGTVNNNMKSIYAQNYRFFLDCIEGFKNSYPTYFPYFPNRIMNNCILLPIEAESQDTALTIFSTLNDRGKPLSDTDIFKAQMYKCFKEAGKKDEFVKRWKALEDVSNRIFKVTTGSPMDELFTRYMYYERAKQGIKNTTTEALRKFYEKDNYRLLKNNETLENLESLADFWEKIDRLDDSLSDEVLRALEVLQYAPNGMWTYLLSVYYMHNRKKDGSIDEKQLCEFLDKITAFIWAYALLRPGVNALRSPAYPEMIKIVTDKQVDFAEFKFNESDVRNSLNNYTFSNGRPITKSILAWWLFQNPNQELVPMNTILEIEHIYSKKREDNEKSLKNPNNIESLGNKALLEKGINIRASDYRFSDKKKYYEGFTTGKGKVKSPTINVELREIANNKKDFTESEITTREKIIVDSFIDYLKKNDLIK
ncbi:DUF262 domain-containing protein [Mobilibacterium timonense]|uniref:DUF262 domain-containing protein n=1 Tax=Mobilibacterium timonense TaxID=1871012 RepID=UPI0009877F66|nr:DUF262 domain-containing protein [Mobilibacterium timonense]